MTLQSAISQKHEDTTFSAAPRFRPTRRPADLIQLRQSVDDVDGLHADADDLLDEVDDVARIVRILVRIVDDAALLVLGDLIPIDKPADGSLAVHHIFVGAWRNVLDNQVFGDLEHGQVGNLLAGFRILDLTRIRQFNGTPRIDGIADFGHLPRFDLLVTNMQFRQLAAGLLERLEVARERNARQLLLKIVRESRTILFAVQDAVHVVEDILLGDIQRRIHFPEHLQPGIGDRVMADAAMLVRTVAHLVKIEAVFLRRGIVELFIPVQGKHCEVLCICRSGTQFVIKHEYSRPEAGPTIQISRFFTPGCGNKFG